MNGLHPADVERMLAQLNRLIDLGNTVILVEQDMYVVANSDWVIDIGPRAADEGGTLHRVLRLSSHRATAERRPI